MHEIINKLNIREIKRFYHYVHGSRYVFSGHRHRDIEVNIILDGELEITTERGIYSLKKGNMVMFPSYSFHQNRVTGNKSAEMIVVHFEAYEDYFKNEFSLCIMDPDIEALTKIFIREMEKYSLVTDGLCVKICANALKLYEVILQKAFVNKEKPSLKESEYSGIYNRAVSFMQENLSSPITIASVAKECGVCTTTIKNLFSYYTGRGCISFFNELRLSRAKELLLQGKSCLEVSDELAFSSQGHFSRRFKQMYGVSPVKYKK